MKKILSLFLVLTVVFAFSSCEQKPEDAGTTETPSPKETVIDINAVKDKIIAEAELTDPLEIKAEALCELYSIDEADVSEAVCVTTMNGTFPDEVIIIKAASEEAKKRISDILTSHLEDVKVQSQNYDAENYALAQECKVIGEGNYLALFVSAKHAQMEKIFNESVNK